MADQIQQRIENLGPAEKVIQTILTHADHAVHNRPGMVVPDARTNIGVRWEPVTHKVEDGIKVVYKLVKVGKKSEKVRVGVLGDDGKIRDGRNIVGEYRAPGLFPEIAAWMYAQVAEVHRMDNEFAARWASYAFPQEHRDLKVVLAAFMLVQSRKGDPVREGGVVLFHDEDYRDVGEAMVLLRRTDGKDLNPKLLIRAWDLLHLPQIAEINRKLGFGLSAKNPALGRLPKAIEKWLRQRERNPKMLAGLVKAGFRTTVMALAQRVHYKPETDAFFRLLRWKQKQSVDGRRGIAIGTEVEAAESWAGLTEIQICERIIATKPNWKRIVGLLPEQVGVTRAIVAATVQAGALSNADLIILTPTLEDLGLLTVSPIKEAWEGAVKAADNQRAANIAARVKNKDTAEKLVEASDKAVAKAVEEAVKGLRVYVFVDISGSMTHAIETAKTYITKLLGGFPLDKLHVAVFNSSGRVVNIRHASQAGVTQAFSGIGAGGGTSHAAGVRALQDCKTMADEDALFIFIGDEQDSPFAAAVQQSGLNPTAFGLVKVSGGEHDRAVRSTADQLGIPCFRLDEGIFADPYAITRALRNLIAATPVGKANVARVTPRVSLVETILKTDLLQKPMI